MSCQPELMEDRNGSTQWNWPLACDSSEVTPGCSLQMLSYMFARSLLGVGLDGYSQGALLMVRLEIGGVGSGMKERLLV